MKHFEITISIRDARKVQDLFTDNRGFRENLSQDASNVWSDYYDEETFGEIEDEDYADECLMDLLDELTSFLDDNNIEYEYRVWNED